MYDQRLDSCMKCNITVKKIQKCRTIVPAGRLSPPLVYCRPSHEIWSTVKVSINKKKMIDVFKDNIQIASIGDSSYLYQREGIRICKGKNRVILEKI